MSTTQTVRGAVERADQAKAAAVSPYQAIKQQVQVNVGTISALLPRGMSPERFAGTIMGAVRAQPKLLECDPRSVIAAALKAAQLGLEPNDPRQLAYLIPYFNKESGKSEAQFQLGYRGQIELGRRSGLIRKVTARKVEPGDGFAYRFGTEEFIVHFPAGQGDVPDTAAVHINGEEVEVRVPRATAEHWYAIAWVRGEDPTFVVLNRAQVEYHRGFSKQPNSPMWAKSYDAAGLKCAIRDLYKLLPQTPDMAAGLLADERTYDLDAMAEPEAYDGPDDDVTDAEVVP